ncbi:uncharacterized protein LOC106645836 [Copidosoma floridanum]|uniref:uncharacterized protein LOC106645836 n=1 Tax=Copidosoma floridanum TaxID=29053 RepID=UPI0006C9C2FD|nr:uncharacterized protein LOC106645836 [Copidosoma floridanum]
MEDTRTALNLLIPHDYVCRIDLKDAFFLVPIHKDHRKYLRFSYHGQLYQFQALPFGLATAPWVFTKIVKPVLATIRHQGIRVVAYLDDFLVFGRSEVGCRKSCEKLISLLLHLGFVVNWKKSELTPTQSIKFLGFIIDSVNFQISLPPDKRHRLHTFLRSLSTSDKICMKDLMKLIGTIVAACPAVAYGWLFYKTLERLKQKALARFGFNKRLLITLSPPAKEELLWWQQQVLVSNNKIRSFHFDVTIFTDASNTGWGAVCGSESAHGSWSSSERKKHINWLEIKAIFLALKCFANEVHGKQILLRVDNTTALAYINKMGGARHEDLHLLAKEIWLWCISRKCWIFAEYIASKQNPADEGSRLNNLDTEWQLADFAFEEICQTFGTPDIDLFASRINAKCPKFCSWERDPEAWAINAFTIPWSPIYWYSFPPFAIIHKVLKKEAAAPAIVLSYPGGRSCLRQAYVRRNLDADTIELLISSLADNTWRQYDSALRLWWTYCQSQQNDPFDTDVQVVLRFLSNRYKEGAAYGTLSSIKAAVTLINPRGCQDTHLISRFFKGVYRQRPTAPKYATTWDVGIVLKKLEEWSPTEDLELRLLTWKTVMLLALGSAFRVQALTLIKIENIKFSNNNKVEIRIPDLIKTSRPGANQPMASFDVFQNSNLCVYRTIRLYLQKTAPIRESASQLFISYQTPHKAVSKDTVSRWLKAVLREAGIQEVFTAHSTRHASTTRAHQQGLNINVIKQAAGWSESSKTFFRFYNRPIEKSIGNFSKTVLDT